MIRIGGPQARAMLAKLSSIDLHPSAFPLGAAAATSIDHTSVNLWRGDDCRWAGGFNLLVFATFAESLWHTMLDCGGRIRRRCQGPRRFGLTFATRRAFRGGARAAMA